MLTRIIIIVFMLSGFTQILAQAGTAIRGRIIDSKSRQPLEQAAIEVVELRTGDVADSEGAFAISNIPAGEYDIRASIIGYKSVVKKNVRIIPGQIIELNFELEAILLELGGVQIEAERLWEKYLNEASLVGVEQMKARGVINIPGALDDPLRAVQVFSGVSGGGDYSGFMTVRGGSPDQNQVIVDGVLIPNPYRFRLAFGGGMSSINPATTEDIYMHLGGFSAEYGNSMTSILEVQTRKGNTKRIRTEGTLNLTDVSGIIEGPLPGIAGSFLLSVRRTYYDLLVKQITQSNSIFPFFLEYQSRFDFELGKNHRLTLQLGQNREGTELLNEFSEDLNLTEDVVSRVASLTWKNILSQRWQLNTILSYYKDDMSYRAFAADTASKLQEFESIDARVTHIAGQQNVRYRSGRHSWVNAGISVTHKPSRVQFSSADLSLLYARIESPRDIDFDKEYTYYAAYLESASKASNRLHIRLGGRYDYSTLIKQGEFSPRFNLWFNMSDRTKLESSWGVFYQYPNPMSVYSRNIPVDISNEEDFISAEKATHFVVGIEHLLSENLTTKLQLYYKDIDRLLLPLDEISFRPANNGRGLSRGFEFILEKKPLSKSLLSGILTYSFGKSQYRLVDQKNWLPFKYDRRHALTGLLNIRLLGDWNFSVLGQYSTGLPFTDVIGRQTSLNEDGTVRWDFVRGERFRARFPDFKKIDLRLSYNRHLGFRAFSLYVDVINITNEQNLYEITWEKKFLQDDTARATTRKIYMLPLIPSFGFSFRL